MDLGTLIHTWLNGTLVGTDEFGNRYYTGKSAPLHGRERRWVVYKGNKEASKVPPEWHAWLHHTTVEPLTESAAEAPEWHLDHLPNVTGTVGAYRPKGHEYEGGQRAKATGDYEAWTPE